MTEVGIKKYRLTPEELEEYRRKTQSPRAKPWERTMTLEQYLQAVADGRSLEDIILKHYNNDPKELREQLRDWGINQYGEEIKVARGVLKELTITKDEYLRRRLNGETRSRIMRQLGGGQPKFYALLKEWGIRELDAEERELELMSATRPTKEIDQRVDEEIEQKAETRESVEDLRKADTEPANGQEPSDHEQELANLRAAVEMWKRAAEQKDAEIARLKDAMSGAAAVSTQAGDGIKELERRMLLQTNDLAAGHISLRIPLPTVAVANAERTRIYAAVEALSDGVEAADIDRERVMRELFELLQRAVNFITADLAELHPGQEVTKYVQEFFRFYNDRHVEALSDIKKAG